MSKRGRGVEACHSIGCEPQRMKAPIVVDLAPRWRTLVPILLSAIEHGTDRGRTNARRKFRNLAREADAQRELQLRTRDALARLVATCARASSELSGEEEEALAEANAVLAISSHSLLEIQFE